MFTVFYSYFRRGSHSHTSPANSYSCVIHAVPLFGEQVHRLVLTNKGGIWQYLHLIFNYGIVHYWQCFREIHKLLCICSYLTIRSLLLLAHFDATVRCSQDEQTNQIWFSFRPLYKTIWGLCRNHIALVSKESNPLCGRGKGKKHIMTHV